jgi:hypothetical protein
MLSKHGFSYRIFNDDLMRILKIDMICGKKFYDGFGKVFTKERGNLDKNACFYAVRIWEKLR